MAQTAEKRSGWTTLQDALYGQARLPSTEQKHMVFYPLGELDSPPRVVSYRALYDQAHEISPILASLVTFRQHSPVLLHLDDHWDCLSWLWAVLLANGVPVLSSPLSNIDDHRRSHLENLSQLLESPICIVRESSAHLFRDIDGLQMHTVESLLRLTPTVTTPKPSIPTPPPTPIVTPNHPSTPPPALLMLTSGSTGNAKAVPLSHRQILAAVSGKASVRPLPRDTSFLNWIALDHVASLVEIHIQALVLGLDQVHVHPADIVSAPLRFVELLSRHRVSRAFAPGFFLARVVAADAAAAMESRVGKDKNWDLSSLRIVASGGEANHVATVAAAAAVLERYGAPRNAIVTGFGMTETCAGAIFNLSCPEQDVARGRAVAGLGRCMPDIEMRVAREGADGAWMPCEPGESGHLQVRGDVVFEGYYRNPAATADAFTEDGWFKTGDQAALDEDGNLSLTGRFKDVININGVKVVTADLQAAVDMALRNIPRVSRVVVFPSRAQGAATEQVTVASLTKEWPPEAEEMAEIERLTRQACIMASSACTQPVVFAVGPETVPLLPVTTLGKISGAKMRKLFEAGLFDRDVEYHRSVVEECIKRKSQRTTQDWYQCLSEFEAALRDDIADILGLADSSLVGVDQSAFELGFSSMDVIRLKQRIATRLGVSVPIITFLNNNTVRRLAVALDKTIATAPFPSESAIDVSEPFNLDSYDPVVTLCPKGARPPLWLIHPGLGEVLVFVGLSQRLAQDDRPVYALRARGFEPNQPHFTSIPEAVDTYVAAIRQKQPVGPYVLAGYSYGGMLAFEMAKKLDNVQFLASFDLPPHIRTLPVLPWSIWFLNLAHFLGLISTNQFADFEGDAAYSELSRPEAFEKVMAVADRERMEEQGLTQDAIERWVSVAFGLQSMAVDYEPLGKVPCGVDVFHAEPLAVVARSREAWVANHLSRWSEFCKDGEAGLRLHAVGGAHFTMLGPDYVEEFAERLREAMAARGV